MVQDWRTGPQLVEDAYRDAGDVPTDPAFSDICDAYESAFSQAVTDAIETAARAILTD